MAGLIISSNLLADERCASKKDDWTCFGTMQVQSDPAGPRWRMSKFPNGEFLAQIETGASSKSLLVVQPSGLRLYRGLSADESALTGKANPFARMDLAFARQLVALRLGFPAGPSSVPDGESIHRVLLPGDEPVTITTVRTNHTRLTYKLESVSAHGEGAWDGATQNPLPQSYSLIGWTGSGNQQFRSLKQAREASVPQASK
jgi:hypothetical protein